MSRGAARRNPPAQTKAPRRPARATPRASGGTARRAAAPSRGIRGLLYPEWARNIVSELRKVVWPSAEETRSLTTVVIVVAVSVGIILGVVDFGFSELVKWALL